MLNRATYPDGSATLSAISVAHPEVSTPAVKQPLAAAEHGRGEPDEHDREPAHEHRGIQPIFAQPIGGLVQAHARDRRIHDDREQRQECPGQRAIDGVRARRVAAQERVTREQDWQHQRGDGHELEEAATRVVGVAHARGRLDECVATEEVA